MTDYEGEVALQTKEWLLEGQQQIKPGGQDTAQTILRSRKLQQAQSALAEDLSLVASATIPL